VNHINTFRFVVQDTSSAKKAALLKKIGKKTGNAPIAPSLIY